MCQGLREITSHISVREHRQEKYVYYDVHDLLQNGWAVTITVLWMVSIIIIVLKRHSYCSFSSIDGLFLYNTIQLSIPAPAPDSVLYFMKGGCEECRWYVARLTIKSVFCDLCRSYFLDNVSLCLLAHSAAQCCWSRRACGRASLLLLHGPRQAHQSQLHPQR